MLSLNTAGSAVLYHRVSRAQQLLIIGYDLPVHAKRVALSSRRRITQRGEVYEGILTWEIHHGSALSGIGTEIFETPAEVTAYSRFVGTAPVGWPCEPCLEVTAN